MTVSRFWPLALAALAFTAAGCDGGRKNPPDVGVRIVNVAPSYSALQYKREQSTREGGINGIEFKNSVAAVYDEDTYDFSVDVRDPTTGIWREARSFTKAVEDGTLYTFALVQSGTGIQEVFLEAQPPAATATDAQVLALHAAEGTPALDVFLEPPGTDIAGVVPWGTIGFLGQLPARTVAAGDYEMTLTEAGNRSHVLLTSNTFTLGAADSIAFIVTPEGGGSVADISVVVVSGFFSGNLVDRNTPAEVRVFNAAADQSPRDVAFNSQFTPPLFSAVPFAAPAAYVPIAPGVDIPVNVTPAGNPGVIELDQTVSPLGTRRHTLFITGETGALAGAFLNDDRRRITGEAQLRYYHGATQFPEGLDFLVLPADNDPTTAAQAASLVVGTVGISTGIPPGDYNLWLRQTFTTTIVAGPIPITLAGAGIYGALATNGPDTATATITLIDDFQ